MRILVTNDDGIDSLGLHVLARRLTDLGDVVVVAPDREYSGFGAALGTLHLMQPEVQRQHIDGVPEAWAVTGPPALCVYFARFGSFGDIDLVVSGINPGANTGRAIYHSGTVGAAITARNGGINGIAVSQSVVGFGVEGQGWDEMIKDQRWETAAEVAARVTEAMAKDLPDPPIVVNVNVPNVELDEITAWRHTQVGTIPPRSVTSATLEPREGYEDTFYVRMDWGDPVELPVETDGGAVEAGEVSISYLSRIVHDDQLELPAVHSALEDLTDR
ncbi:MAG TPA: 5'/3'-nucleotidase SurE [Acidimicrobiales bacterium]|nr:5'/3'-nucleotidase SurE [Acidimicrobiales bacterium]